MLSLSPRYDQFRFCFDKSFLPKEVNDKWQDFMAKDAGVLTTPIDYLNESIKGITFPGITDLIITQPQHSTNPIVRKVGRMNVEPNQNNSTYATNNPLDKIQREITITFRMNQGLYNYFMLYETIFYKICKPHLYPPVDKLYIDILNEEGLSIARIVFTDCHIDGIEGLEFDYTKLEREVDSFQVTFKFNNIDFELMDK